jgi:hypothetical protein
VKTAKWASDNREKVSHISLAWAKRNPEKMRKQKAKQRAADPLKMRKWSLENPEKMRACRSRWDASNKDRKVLHSANRRGRKYSATPVWSNGFLVREIYHLAKIRTEVTGLKWEVDHIVPLAGKTVCGLHCEQNMQVVLMPENRRKSRYHWPDMP